MSRLRRLLSLAGLLLLGLMLPEVQGFLREEVVAPLLYLLWVAYLLLESVPQLVYWALLVLVVLAVAWQQSGPPLARRRAAPKLAGPESRLAAWAQLLEQAPRASYDRWLLAQRLARLSAEVLAERYRLPPEEVRRALARGALELPLPLKAYLEQGLSRHEPWSEGPAFLKARARVSYADVAALLDYLESELEGRVYA